MSSSRSMGRSTAPPLARSSSSPLALDTPSGTSGAASHAGCMATGDDDDLHGRALAARRRALRRAASCAGDRAAGGRAVGAWVEVGTAVRRPARRADLHGRAELQYALCSSDAIESLRSWWRRSGACHPQVARCSSSRASRASGRAGSRSKRRSRRARTAWPGRGDAVGKLAARQPSGPGERRATHSGSGFLSRSRRGIRRRRGSRSFASSRARSVAARR
jgi:hypothetical protein